MENKTEFQIGEEFQCGLVRLKCIAQREDLGTDCTGCILDGINCCAKIDILMGRCADYERTDKRNVIFVKVEE